MYLRLSALLLFEQLRSPPNLFALVAGWAVDQNIRSKASGLTILDQACTCGSLNRSSNTLIRVVNTRFPAVRVDVGKHDTLELGKLFKTDHHGRIHHPPRNSKAGWFRDSSIIAIEENIRHQGVRKRIKPLGNDLKFTVLQSLSHVVQSGVHFPSQSSGVCFTFGFVKVVHRLELIQNILKVRVEAIHRGSNGHSNGCKSAITQMGKKHLDLGIKFFAVDNVFTRNLDVVVVHIRIVGNYGRILWKICNGRTFAITTSASSDTGFRNVQAISTGRLDAELMGKNLFLKGVIIYQWVIGALRTSSKREGDSEK